MKRVLLTGMSGTGKSTVIREFAASGYKAIDTDSDEWSEWVNVDSDRSGSPAEQDRVWREERIQRLLATGEGGRSQRASISFRKLPIWRSVGP